MTEITWVCIGIIGAIALVELAATLRRILSSLQSTEAMMRRLLAHEGVEWEAATEPSARVRDLALNPKSYVEAIKTYREQTGAGLAEAKAVVDGLARARRGAA